MKNQARKVCSVCGKEKSSFILNNKAVCLTCDELLFDLEIECEESDKFSTKEKAVTQVPATRSIIQVVKK